MYSLEGEIVGIIDGSRTDRTSVRIIIRERERIEKFTGLNNRDVRGHGDESFQ